MTGKIGEIAAARKSEDTIVNRDGFPEVDGQPVSRQTKQRGYFALLTAAWLWGHAFVG
jgi:hypothetical protein